MAEDRAYHYTNPYRSLLSPQSPGDAHPQQWCCGRGFLPGPPAPLHNPPLHAQLPALAPSLTLQAPDPPPPAPPCQSAPWSHQPFLHHGSSLRQLQRGPPSWLWSGSCLAPPALAPACRLLGSSLWLLLPPSSPPWSSACLPSCLPFAAPSSSSHTPFRPPWFILLRCEITPSGKGEYCQGLKLYFCIFLLRLPVPVFPYMVLFLFSLSSLVNLLVSHY